MARVQVLGEDEEGGWRKKKQKPQTPNIGPNSFDGNVRCSCEAQHPANPKLGCLCTEIKQYKGKRPKNWMCGPCGGGDHRWAPIF